MPLINVLKIDAEGASFEEALEQAASQAHESITNLLPHYPMPVSKNKPYVKELHCSISSTITLVLDDVI